MAQGSAVLTYDTVGNREDLADVIFNITPQETPMLSRFGKTKASNTTHEWLQDSLTTSADNVLIEGADYTYAKPTARTRVSNWTQIFATTIEVSDTQRAVDSAGLDDEFAYQMAKKMKEHARDIEYALVNGTGNSGASGTARRLKGVLSAITTNNTTGTGTGNEALSETMFNDLLQNIWNAGGTPDTIFVSGSQKRAISAFTGGATKNVNSSEKEVIMGVDVYDSDFGRLKIILDRFMPAGTIVALQSDMWKVAVLRPTHKVDIAKISSSTKGVIETELTLEYRQQAASGKATELS